MASSFTPPTLDEITALLVADYAGRFPRADVSQGSHNWKRLRTTALGCLSLHAHLKKLYEDLMPDGATGDQLARHGGIYNVARKPATPSSGATALRVYGSAASTVHVGDALTHVDGTAYQVNVNASIPGGGTYVDVDLLSISLGSATRKKAGTSLTFTSPPAGIKSTAVLQADLVIGGADVETDGDYRARILAHIAQPGMGGNAHDYEAWALEVAGVATAYVFPGRQGLGSVDLAFLKSGRGAARIPAAPEIADVQAHIDAVRPVSVADFRVLTCASQVQDVEALLYPEDGAENAFDWLDSTPPTVGTWTGATRTLTLSARPTDLRAGHRLIIKNTTTPNDGSQVIVESLGAGNDVVLTAVPSVAPEVGAAVYSGGPLVDPARDALLAHLDTLGPGRGVYAGSNWIGTLYTSAIFKIVQLTPGVLDSTIVTPGANVTPADSPPSATVYVIIPRQTICRKGW